MSLLLSILVSGIILAIFAVSAVTISYLVEKELFVPQNKQESIHYRSFTVNIVIMIILTLVDFYLVSFLPVITNQPYVTQIILISLFVLFSIMVIIITLKMRHSILSIKVSTIERNNKFLNYSFWLILIQEVIITFFYTIALLNLFLTRVDRLTGTVHFFNIGTDQIANIELISDPSQLFFILILIGTKAAFLLLHHSSIVFIFITLFVIFSEWNARAKEPPISFFKYFCLGFILQGIGQILQSLTLVINDYILFNSGIDATLPPLLTILFTVGAIIIATGAVLYFFSFMLASLFLLNNISHLLFPKSVIVFLKISVIILPFIYSILYAFQSFLAIVWFFIGLSPALVNIATFLEDITSFIDLPAMILLPLSAGLFFILAYRQGKEKKELRTYVLWTFFSLFLIFGVGNNTMSTLSWFGMLHGPISLLGTILLLYGLSRVADHASRHRRIIQEIRSNPEEFSFLADLGKAERKIQLHAKVDSLVTSGAIKPLVPTTNVDETKVAAEINSYMTEISRVRKRQRKRVPQPIG